MDILDILYAELSAEEHLQLIGKVFIKKERIFHLLKQKIKHRNMKTACKLIELIKRVNRLNKSLIHHTRVL